MLDVLVNHDFIMQQIAVFAAELFELLARSQQLDEHRQK